MEILVTSQDPGTELIRLKNSIEATNRIPAAIVSLGANWDRESNLIEGNFQLSVQSKLNAVIALVISQKTNCKKIIFSTGNTAARASHKISEARAMMEFLHNELPQEVDGIVFELEENSFDTLSNATEVSRELRKCSTAKTIENGFILLTNKYHLHPRSFDIFKTVFSKEFEFMPKIIPIATDLIAEELLNDKLLETNPQLKTVVINVLNQYRHHMNERSFITIKNWRFSVVSQGPMYHYISDLLYKTIGPQFMQIAAGLKRNRVRKNKIEM